MSPFPARPLRWQKWVTLQTALGEGLPDADGRREQLLRPLGASLSQRQAWKPDPRLPRGHPTQLTGHIKGLQRGEKA